MAWVIDACGAAKLEKTLTRLKRFQSLLFAAFSKMAVISPMVFSAKSCPHDHMGNLLKGFLSTVVYTILEKRGVKLKAKTMGKTHPRRRGRVHMALCCLKDIEQYGGSKVKELKREL